MGCFKAFKCPLNTVSYLYYIKADIYIIVILRPKTTLDPTLCTISLSDTYFFTLTPTLLTYSLTITSLVSYKQI